MLIAVFKNIVQANAKFSMLVGNNMVKFQDVERVSIFAIAEQEQSVKSAKFL